ncbi:hypothetical protein EMCRGX_G026506 [Ephydatia muelleri]
MWLWLAIPIVAYLLYRVFQFATANADNALCSKRLKAGYLHGKVVWITGASSGIGEALSYELSSLDVKLILSARSEDKLVALRDKLKTPENVRVLVIDMSKPETLVEAVAKATSFSGRVDILINNAGVTTRSSFRDIKEQVGRTVMEVDFFGPVLLTQALLPVMLSNGFGHIVNISSIAGKLPVQVRSYYCAAKTALIALMNVVRLEMGEQNIVVTNVCPGPVKTLVDVNAFNHDGSKYNKTDSMISNGMSSKSKNVACSPSALGVLYTRPVDVIGLVFIKTWARLINSSSSLRGKENDGEGPAGLCIPNNVGSIPRLLIFSNNNSAQPGIAKATYLPQTFPLLVCSIPLNRYSSSWPMEKYLCIMLTGHVAIPVRAITKDAPSLYCSVLLDVICITMLSELKATSAHLSFNNSSHLRKPANAARQIASKRTSVREGDDPAASTIAATSPLSSSLRFLGLANSRLRPPKVACTMGDPAMDGKSASWCNHETACTASSTADFD